MRFDDSLTTVLAADTGTPFGAQSAWRQLIDLVARRRAGDGQAAIERLRALTNAVPVEIRAASARAMALATPPVGLVAMLAEDEPTVAAAALRATSLPDDAWLALLPQLSPVTRGVLRARRDLSAAVVRGLESFGATDFVIAHDGAAAAPIDAAPVPPIAAPAPVVPDAPLDRTPFIAIGEAARAIPVVAEALKQAGEAAPRFEIADLVARIDAFQRDRVAVPLPPPPPPAPAPDRWEFATDAAGVIRWVSGIPRGLLIGVSLARGDAQGAIRLDAVAGGALRRRTAFRDARLEIGGESEASGSWRLAGEPCFDAAAGCFVGMRGVARRPLALEAAAPATAADQLRQLVHELRTPANAIAGFAELIGSELLGPVAAVYRERAVTIQRQAADLLGAIDDLDMAARIEGRALDLRPGTVDLAELVRQAASDMAPLADERGAMLTVELEPAPVLADDRAAQRLVSRLLRTLLGIATPGERLRVQVTRRTRNARLAITRPRALAVGAGETLLAIDADTDGGSLLGTGFALRLTRNLAAALDGRLTVEEDRLLLRLPLAIDEAGEQAAAE